MKHKMRLIVAWVLREIVKLWDCRIWDFHDWTCAAVEGIPPTDEQLGGGVEGFYDYARMYCKRCGKESEISQRYRKGARHE